MSEAQTLDQPVAKRRRNARPRTKTHVITALLAGANDIKAIRTRTGLSSIQVTQALQALRRMGVIEVAERGAVYTGARPGNTYRIKGGANG